MKLPKRVLSALFAGMAASVLAGCTQESEPPTPSAAESELDGQQEEANDSTEPAAEAPEVKKEQKKRKARPEERADECGWCGMG